MLMVMAGCAAARDKGPGSIHLVSVGEGLARDNCGECHGMGDTVASPLADAPRLRTLSRRYSRDQLAALLAKRMTDVHQRMPKLHLDEDEVAALLDYLDRQP
jgi:cytochrome c